MDEGRSTTLEVGSGIDLEVVRYKSVEFIETDVNSSSEET
jgi:hypothetical protein